jgi:demethylmenaquinone methyltransferase/2-methoxy-6-polyprenyl-1,4-benzoquinol methylase
MFSAIAPSYDRLNRLLSLSTDRLWRRRAVARSLAAFVREERGRISVEANPIAAWNRPRVLDVCAGTGDLARAYARRLSESGCVVALDFSREMLRHGFRKISADSDDGRSSAATRGRPRQGASILPVEGDALRLPFGAGEFDLAAVAFGLRNLVDMPGGLAEMARVVRPGGQVVALEFGLPEVWWMRSLYGFYLHRVLSRVGNRVSGSVAYAYLVETVQSFPSPAEVQSWMRDAGLVGITSESWTGGIVRLYRGLVPSKERTRS